MMHKKSKEALRTIGEVSEILDLPPHIIRFWETKFSHVKPTKYNNRRYYSSNTVNLLKTIKELLYTENYSINDALLYFKNNQKKHAQLALFTIKPDLSLVKNKLIEARCKLDALLQKS